MTETSKTNSISKMEEKACLLDEEIGKGFLSSWKSMSMPDDDIMDFNFETPEKNKKAFNFEKLDMDFDNNFDKISSFKVDISDLDLSSPAETGKVKGPNTFPHKDKEDHFSFSFDFKELEEFDFSKIAKDKDISSEGKPIKVAPLGTNECGETKRTHPDKSSHASDDRVNMDIFPSESDTILQHEISKGKTPNFDQREKIKFTKNMTSIISDQQGEDPLPVPKRTEMDIGADKHHFTEKDSISTAMYYKKSFPEIDLVQNSDLFCSTTKNISDHSDGPQISIVKAITGLQSHSDNDNPMLLDSGLLNSVELQNKENSNDKIIGGNYLLAVNMNDTEPIQNKMYHEGTSVLTVSKSNSHERKSTNATHASKTNLISSPINREKFTARKECSGFVVLRFLERHEDVRQLRQASHSKSQPKNIFGKILPASTSKISATLGSSSTLVGKNETESAMRSKEIGFVSSKRSCTDSHNNAGLHTNSLLSPGQLINPSAERPTVPTVTVSSMDAMRTSILSNSMKFSSTRASKRTPGLNYNIQMNNGEGSSNTQHCLDKTAVNLSEIVKEVHGNKSMVLEADAFCEEKKIASAAAEDENVDVLPPLSPKKSELPTLTSLQVGEKDEKVIYSSKRSVAFGNEEQIKRVPLMNKISETSEDDTKDESNIGEMAIPMEIDTTIAKVPMDDSHVVKAEAYSKKLDSLCMSVRKKQEEAKEVMGRALVSSSQMLLMMNNPICHHKFYMVQRLADKLMDKHSGRQ